MFVVQKFRYSALNEIDNQCTSTGAPVVRGFKVDGDEGGRIMVVLNDAEYALRGQVRIASRSRFRSAVLAHPMWDCLLVRRQNMPSVQLRQLHEDRPSPYWLVPLSVVCCGLPTLLHAWCLQVIDFRPLDAI